jgi:hypothetical protein
VADQRGHDFEVQSPGGCHGGLGLVGDRQVHLACSSQFQGIAGFRGADDFHFNAGLLKVSALPGHINGGVVHIGEPVQHQGQFLSADGSGARE